MIELQNTIYFSSKTEDMDLQAIFMFVKNAYWGQSRTIEQQHIALQNSINFGIFHHKKQIAYARVMTDYVFFAYLLDVFVIDDYQGNGYSKLLLEQILNYPELKNIDKWMLATKDAHGLYEKFGFETVKDSSKLMNRMSQRAKDVYG